MTAWLVVHIGMMLFIPLMAGGIYLLLRGVEVSAARVSRIALVPFVVFFSAWETLQGTANGVLVNELNRLPEQEARGRVKVDSGLRGESPGPRSRRLREYRKPLDP